MADYGFIAQPQNQNSMQRIGEMINFARGVTDLQKSRATMETDIEQRRAESARAVTEAGVAAQTAQPRVAQQAAQTSTAQTQAQSSQWAFDRDQAMEGYRIAGGLAQDPRIVAGDPTGTVDALLSAEDQMRSLKIPEAKIRMQMAPLYALAAKNPAGMRSALDNIVRAGAGAGAQANIANAPLSAIQDGSNINLTQMQPGATGGAGVRGTMPLELPLGERQNVSINPLTKAPMTTTKDAQGNVVGVSQTPTGAGVPQLAPGQPEDIPILTTLRSTVNNAAARVPESRFNNSQILRLADETNTGRGAEILRNMKGGYAALPWTADAAKNYDTLGHFIALEAGNAAAAMNAGTDAARSLAEQKTASTGWTADAIKSAVKVNDALAVGLENFNKGMEAAVNRAGGNILAVRPFQNAWSAAFDPNVYRYANAMQAGDKAEMTRILGAEGSPARRAKAAELAKKSAALHRLTTEGQ